VYRTGVITIDTSLINKLNNGEDVTKILFSYDKAKKIWLLSSHPKGLELRYTNRKCYQVHSSVLRNAIIESYKSKVKDYTFFDLFYMSVCSKPTIILDDKLYACIELIYDES